MKFLWVMLIYSLIALLIGYGILLTVQGNPWVLVIGSLTYLLLLTKFGLLQKEGH